MTGREGHGCVGRQFAASASQPNRSALWWPPTTPRKWLAMMTDPMLAQSAVDRLASTAHELVIEGPSYRQRQKPSINGRPAGVPVDHEKGIPAVSRS